MHLFITGGNGFIGSAVVRRLVGEGVAVTCLLRETSDTARIRALPHRRVIGDVRDPDSLRRGMAGCDGVVHLASIANWNDIRSPLMHAVVVDGTAHVLAAARELGLRTVYVSSSTAINGTRRPMIQDERSRFELSGRSFAYAGAKHQAEQLCQSAAAAGQAVVIVNPTEVYGPDDTALVTAGNLIDFIRNRPVLVCSGGTSVVHVDDVAAGIHAAFLRGRSGERYVLGGENLTIRQLAELAFDLLGQRRLIVTMPNSLVRALAWLGSTCRLPLPFNPAVIPYATRYWMMDAAKAANELGVRFRPARETLAPTIAWLRDSGRIGAV